MQLSTRGRYAVMALIDLLSIQREIGEERPIKLAQIADRQQISLSYLEQLFAQLRKSGLVASVRGPGGGYILAKPSYDTWLGDIVSAVDENINVTRCTTEEQMGCMNGQKKCNAHFLWVALGSCIASFLNQLSLEMVMNNDYGDFTPMEALDLQPKQATKAQIMEPQSQTQTMQEEVSSQPVSPMYADSEIKITS